MNKKTALLALALIALVATVSAAVWLLTVKVPVVYKEPLVIEFSDETALPTWYELALGETHTLPAVNLTLRTFDVYVNATNNGRTPVNLTVTIIAYNGTEVTNLIGFSIDGGDFTYGTIAHTVTVGADETVSGKVTYRLSWDAPYPDPGTFQIVWTLERSEP